MWHALEHQFEIIRRKLEVLVWFIGFEGKQEVTSDSRCNVVRAKVVSEDMGVGENGAKVRATRKYSLTSLIIKLQSKHL
jgi:hypothetical protein